ncbi:hypothetical protein CLV58_13032 [Spirosoma oryzae]|uniref:Uncharacterized protein n=2 Tax=Spirosoma oryzae TaxID=1469603 RepID=A0A2T0S422_9BACT|nr:hypothetical protein CLV58_13032 [Spirosoma oryzae]
MICSAITVVKLTELIRLKLFNPISRFMLILVIYVVIYGLRAGPYMIASFFQPMARNVLAQFFLLFLLIELCLHYIGLNLARKRR